MKKILIILMLLVAYSSYAQYDYFRWKRVPSDLTNATISPYSDITSDIFNRIFYINNVNKKVTWIYGEVVQGSYSARSTSNLVYINDPVIGDEVFYIGADNKVRAVSYSNINQSWSNNNIYVQTSYNVGASSYIDAIDRDNVFLFSTIPNNKIHFCKNNGGVVTITPILYTFPISWTNIVHRNDNEVFFINSSRKLTVLTKSGSNWLPTNIDCELIKPYSKIQTTNATNQIFYVRESDSRVCSYWRSGSQSGYGVCDEKSVPVRQGSDLHISSGGDQVFYIGTDNNFHVLFYEGCQWVDNLLNVDCDATSSYVSFGLNSVPQITYFDGSHLQILDRPTYTQDFVYRKSTRLEKDGIRYNAKIADYCPTFYRRDGILFIGPHPHYTETWWNWLCLTSGSCSSILNQHFQNISSAGFNAIRFNDLYVCCNNDANLANPNSDPNLYIYVYDIDGSGLNVVRHFVQVTPAIKTQILDCYEGIVNMAGNYGLKVNLFPGNSNFNKSYNSCSNLTYGQFLFSLADKLKNNPYVLMYSILLEPDWNTDLTKGTICSMINDWYNTIRIADNKHLVSVGVCDYFCLENFDPGMMNVDVVTWHLYPDQTQVWPNYNYEKFYQKLHWISNNMYHTIKKPWIIGETGIPSADDPGSYTGNGTFNLIVTDQEQRDYGIISLNNIFSSGASGYGWWQYRDVYAQDPGDLGVYFGIVDHQGNNKAIINPSIFNNPIINDCNINVCPNDYFNHNRTAVNEVNGYVYDQEGKPIKDAFIYINNWDCGGGFDITFTSPSGYFLLKTNCPLDGGHPMKIEAPGKEVYSIVNPTNWSSYFLTNFTCAPPLRMPTPESKTENANYQLFPNPTQGQFTIILPPEMSNDVEVTVCNICGKIVKKETFSKKSQVVIDISNSSNGVYFVAVKNEKSCENFKIIKN